MTITQLDHFVKVCSLGSVSAAADVLFISASGLRMSLHRIETELECKLLNWNAKGVQPTPEGEIFLETAKNMLKTYHICETQLGRRVADNDCVNVAISDHIPTKFVALVIDDYNPLSKKFKVRRKDVLDAQAAVISGEAEIGFDTEMPDKNEFVCLPIIKYPLYALVSEKCPELYVLDEIEPECLERYQLLLSTKKSRNESFLAALKKRNINPNIGDLAQRGSTMVWAVQNSAIYIGITDAENANCLSMPGVKAIPLVGEDFQEEIIMFRKKGNYVSPAAKHFENYLKLELPKYIADPYFNY